MVDPMQKHALTSYIRIVSTVVQYELTHCTPYVQNNLVSPHTCTLYVLNNLVSSHSVPFSIHTNVYKPNRTELLLPEPV